jgi:hypothetical protein
MAYVKRKRIMNGKRLVLNSQLIVYLQLHVPSLADMDLIPFTSLGHLHDVLRN